MLVGNLQARLKMDWLVCCFSPNGFKLKHPFSWRKSTTFIQLCKALIWSYSECCLQTSSRVFRKGVACLEQVRRLVWKWLKVRLESLVDLNLSTKIYSRWTREETWVPNGKQYDSDRVVGPFADGFFNQDLESGTCGIGETRSRLQFR